MNIRGEFSISGLTLLELTITISLSFLVLTLSLPAFKNARFHFLQQLNKHKEAQVAAEVFMAIETPLLRANRLLFAPAVAINSPLISLPNKKNGTDSITFLLTDPERIYWSAGAQTAGELSLCSGDPAANKSPQFFVGISLDGLHALHGQLRRSASHSACDGKSFHAVLEPASLPTPTINEISLAPLLAVIAIDDSFTLYVDTQNRLVRLSHTTSEHQPVTRNVAGLTIEHTASDLLQITLQVSISPELKKSVSHYFAARISRSYVSALDMVF